MAYPLDFSVPVQNGWHYSLARNPPHQLHGAVDYGSYESPPAGLVGSPVLAACSGYAASTSIKVSQRALGNLVLIRCDQKESRTGKHYYVMAAHLAAATPWLKQVDVSQLKTGCQSNTPSIACATLWSRIEKGEQIGTVGHSGTDWPHLHFEVWVGDYSSRESYRRDPYDLRAPTTPESSSESFYPPGGSAYTSCGNNHLWDHCPPEPLDCPGGGNCSGNGECDAQYGVCTCHTGFGPRNATTACDACDVGYSGYPACTEDLTCNCNGHGTCDTKTGRCACATGYTGTTCTECATGYHRSLKSNTCVIDRPCPSACSGNGTCDLDTGVCRCFTSHTGVDCGTPSCADECSPGTQSCSSNSYRSCGDFDADSCLDWSSSSTPCPTQSPSSWSCLGGTSRQRTVYTPTCTTASSCGFAQSTETQTCTGAAAGPWYCNTSASNLERSVTAPTCSSGTCSTATTTETQACSYGCNSGATSCCTDSGWWSPAGNVYGSGATSYSWVSGTRQGSTASGIRLEIEQDSGSYELQIRACKTGGPFTTTGEIFAAYYDDMPSGSREVFSGELSTTAGTTCTPWASLSNESLYASNEVLGGWAYVVSPANSSSGWDVHCQGSSGSTGTCWPILAISNLTRSCRSK